MIDLPAMGIGLTLLLVHLHRLTEHNERDVTAWLGVLVGAGLILIAIGRRAS